MEIDPDASPVEVMKAMVAERSHRSDQQIIDELLALAPLVDETDDRWSDFGYWKECAYPYLALAELAAVRKLRETVRPLLDRACFGDPGEIMRTLKHYLERIMEPDWAGLADVCMAAARSERLGTVMWSLYQLLRIDDERARPVFEEFVDSEHDDIRSAAETGLARLDDLRG